MFENIVLTGSTGFIGKHLISELARKGYKVHCLVSDIPSDIIDDCICFYSCNYRDLDVKLPKLNYKAFVHLG